jgi:hypothetical protein
MATRNLTKRQLRSLYTQYSKGNVSKASIDRDVLGSTGRGKTITRLWESRLGLDTVTR